MASIAEAWPTTLTDSRNEVSPVRLPEDSVGQLSERDIATSRPNIKVVLNARLGEAARSVELALRATQVPSWLQPALLRAGNLLLLQFDWDNDGAQPISQLSIQAALDALLSFMTESTSLPQWTPTRSGGVQLDWHESNVDLEISFEPTHPGGFVILADHKSGTEFEGSLRNRLPDVRSLMAGRLVR